MVGCCGSCLAPAEVSTTAPHQHPSWPAGAGLSSNTCFPSTISSSSSAFFPCGEIFHPTLPHLVLNRCRVFATAVLAKSPCHIFSCSQLAEPGPQPCASVPCPLQPTPRPRLRLRPPLQPLRNIGLRQPPAERPPPHHWRPLTALEQSIIRHFPPGNAPEGRRLFHLPPVRPPPASSYHGSAAVATTAGVAQKA